ncbi:polyhomeotic-like protein 3 isoform X2 [Conger conger]|uniref:polyhomeotic-like protein 3 isoform X2 n=1 Tax=Conger conger TaxID=82655 RepID=UPI002A59CF19|nr:polyhomeotic-like protein 3 isoform X2 [Conger conger]
MKDLAVALPPTPVTAQPDSHTQVSCSTIGQSSISQQAWQVGNGSSSTNQAQIYLHAQMEKNEAQQTSHPTPQSVHTKAPAHPRIFPCTPKSTQQSDPSKKGLCSPIQSHTLMMHKLQCKLSHKMAHCSKLLKPKPDGGQRLVQSVSPQAASQETLPTSPLFSSSQTPWIPVTSVSEVQSQHFTATPTLLSSSSSSAKQSALASQHEASAASPSHDPAHKPPSLSPAPSLAACMGSQSDPRATTSSALELRPLSSVSGQGQTDWMQSSMETPAGKTLVQVPCQDLPPPQIFGKDLQAHLTAPSELPKDLSTKYQMVSLHEMDTGEQVQPICLACPGNEKMTDLMYSPAADSTQILPTELTPAHQEDNCRNTHTNLTNTAGSRQSSTERITDNVQPAHSSAKPLHTSSSQDPLPTAGVPSNSLPNPTSHLGHPESQLPHAVVQPQVLMHLIEGFVIQEGLKPFPVNRSSLMVGQLAKHPEAFLEMTGSEVSNPLMYAWNSTDTDMDDLATDDGMDEVQADMLHCEFCGKRGYAYTFLRSNRFCSTTCVRRFNVSDTKRISTPKATRTGHWNRGKDRRRGRRPSRLVGGSRECFLRQTAQSTGWWPLQAEEEDDPPIPMTTRRRRQAELERERETADSGGSPPTSPSIPALWTVDQVCAFVYTLPGCQDIAEEFRSQEIDGQALLLLTENHLMSIMNIRLGPALKICACINSLK